MKETRCFLQTLVLLVQAMLVILHWSSVSRTKCQAPLKAVCWWSSFLIGSQTCSFSSAQFPAATEAGAAGDLDASPPSPDSPPTAASPSCPLSSPLFTRVVWSCFCAKRHIVSGPKRVWPYLVKNECPELLQTSSVASPKILDKTKCLTLGEQQYFCLGRRFSKRKMTRYAKNLWVAMATVGRWWLA